MKYNYQKISDLVEIPDIRTVVQLEDLKDPDLRGMIVNSFVVTSEVLNNLRAVLASLTGPEGRGIFLKGHFGSGKSHFLGMLSLLIRYPDIRDGILNQDPSLEEFRHRLDQHRLLVVERSLVQHRGSEFLEDIVLRAVFEELGEDAVTRLDGLATRHKTFSALKEILKAEGFSGMVILVDELSEFLRSKNDARAYNEDIRFLQYLGEEAFSFPMWIVAALQEWIEETGEIHQDTFNKIKDRYRIRLNLGRAHIEELVSERLIRHKRGADSSISEIYDDLRAFFPTFPVTRERFMRLYPVHPATSSLLDGLKPLFSEHRGVVDFIHFRLKGDPERHIPSMMEYPSHRLLTPEVIYDHFLDRIKERAETQVYVERVFESCREQIVRLFRDTDQQEIALAAIKLLILFAISPVHYRYTVRHMAEMILFRITSLESEINYQFLKDILDRMVREGLYIRVEKRDDPMEDHYYIDLKADMAGIIRHQIRYSASHLFSEDRRLFWKTAPFSESPYLPIGDWVEKGRQQTVVPWQHTQRSGVLLLRQLDELSADEIEGLSRQQERSEEDYFILVGTTHNREGQYKHVKETLLPRIRERDRGLFLFWIPAPLEGDIARLREFLAAVLIREASDSETGREGLERKKYLDAFIQGERQRITEHFTHLYYHGLLLWDEQELDISRFGFLSQEKFLSEFIPPLLERRFPMHSRIQPYMGALTPSILRDMLRDFLSSGTLTVDNRSKFGIRDVLDNLLAPMGLVRKKANQYELHVNPRQNELAKYIFKVMGERDSVPLDEMYWNLRKSGYGLIMPNFEILVLALLFTGHLVAYKVMNRKNLDELARTGLKGVTALGRGEIISEDFRRAVAENPLVPKPFRKIPITLASQEDLWSELKKQKPSALEDLSSLESKIRWASSFEAFREMPWEGLRRDIEDIKAQWDEVKISHSSKEGLERFLRAGMQEPFLEGKLKAVQSSRLFLDQAERALFVYQYMTDQSLTIPDKDPYSWNQDTRESGVSEGYTPEGYDSLMEDKAGILSFFGKQVDFSPESMEGMFSRFQRFQEKYTRTYVEAHKQARGGDRFEPYERLSRSKRYDILKRLDRLEMVSVEHNYRTVSQALSSVLLYRCHQSPQDHLRARPTCTCGFRLGESSPFKPLKEIERDIELGISETMDALHSPAVQEKVIPYLEGLDLVNRGDEADAIRQFMAIKRDEEPFLDRLDRSLTSNVISGINEAFRGKVVVVKRDLDQLYRSLIHRKYSLDQFRKIIREWVKEESIGRDTFLHFVGRGEEDSTYRTHEEVRDFLEGDFGHLASLYQETGQSRFVKVMITAFWAAQYDLSTKDVAEIFPFLERGGGGETELWITQVDDLGRALFSEKRELFESLVSETEQDSAHIKALWSLLPSESPERIFRKEAVYPSILKEAFERILCGRLDEGVLEGLTSPSEQPGLNANPAFLKRKHEMVDVLQTCSIFRKRGSVLRAVRDPGPDTFAKWESLYVETLSGIPFLKDTLYNDLRRIGTSVPAFLKEEDPETDRHLRKMEDHFRGFYGQELPRWGKKEGPHPLMIQDIPFILSKKRNIPDHRQVRFILMDGMRWDLWQYIRSHFFEKMSNLFRFVREGALWAGQPTNTAAQLQLFEEAFRAAHPDPDHDLFWKINGIDEKIHSEKGPLTHLFANVLGYLELDLLFRLRELPPGTLLIFFSDHGFVENPGFKAKEKYDAPRYMHGKDSPFEVIVPWAWVMRI